MNACVLAGVGWVITIAGFFITNKQANNRQTRQETRSKIDLLSKSLEDLLDASKTYYLDDQASQTRQRVDIHDAINICDGHIEYLSSIKNGIKLQQEFYLLYDKITGGNFESKTHKASEEHDELCIECSILKQDILKSAENWYKNTYL